VHLIQALFLSKLGGAPQYYKVKSTKTGMQKNILGFITALGIFGKFLPILLSLFILLSGLLVS
jgi:hypothetical protein